MVPPLAVCAVIVFESSVVGASGGLPVALAVTFHDPRIEPAIATLPLPVAIVAGVHPAPKQSPIDMVVTADADAGQRSRAVANATTGRNVLLLMVSPFPAIMDFDVLLIVVLPRFGRRWAPIALAGATGLPVKANRQFLGQHIILLIYMETLVENRRDL
jgi:hypothetical protein